MYHKLIFVILIFFITTNCSKKNELAYDPKEAVNPYKIYEEGWQAFEKGDYFYAEKKFSEAELNFKVIEYAAKSSIMASFSLYGINFYNEALENLKRYLNKYPADKNVMYAHYLMAIIHYEQISDEKKDMKPLINANNKIDFFFENLS